MCNTLLELIIDSYCRPQEVSLGFKKQGTRGNSASSVGTLIGTLQCAVYPWQYGSVVLYPALNHNGIKHI